MRWVVLTDDYPPGIGGVATWAGAAVRGLREVGDTVEVFARHRAGLDAAIGVRGRSFARWGGLYMAGAAGAAVVRADAVLAITWPVATGLARPLEGLGIPLHVVVHGSDVTRPARGARDRVLRRARVWAVSEFLRREIEVPAAVLPAPVDAGPVALAGGPWVFVGRAVHTKGGDRFIRIVAEAGVRGELVGGGPELLRWRRLAGEIGADVRFHGAVGREAVDRVLGRAGMVFLLPRTHPDGSGAEGLGLTLLEAAARAVRVVGCRTGGVPEAVGPGLILDDPDDVAGSVQRIRSWEGRGDEGRTWLMANHGVSRTVDALRAFPLDAEEDAERA